MRIWRDKNFAKSGEGIYNPFSLLSTFDNEVFSHYWMESGTPSFMIHLLKKRDWNLSEIDGSKCKGEDLKGADRYLSDPIPLLFQSGYLTIKDYNILLIIPMRKCVKVSYQIF